MPSHSSQLARRSPLALIQSIQPKHEHMDPEGEALLSWRHMVAGAHLFLSAHLLSRANPVLALAPESPHHFPLRTHLQAQATDKAPLSVRTVVQRLWHSGGVPAYFRGVTALAAGAAPAHAVYFWTYEVLRQRLGTEDTWRVGIAGATASLMQDAMMVPLDALKQRRQLAQGRWQRTRDLLHHILAREGVRRLYVGYTTTVSMNVPYHALYVNVYEASRGYLAHRGESDPLRNHVFSGAVAGAVAAAATNPLDVARTRLQTAGEVGETPRGMLRTLASLWQNEGVRGLSRGVGPRVLFNSCSAGILWGVYEGTKYDRTHILTALTL